MRGVIACCALAMVACTDPPAAPKDPHTAIAVTVAAPSASASATPEPPAGDPELDRNIASMLAKVVKARHLPAKTPVVGARLGRVEVIERIMTKTEKELPKGVLEAQGEMLRGMGLIDTDYDFVAGIYGLIQENLAGYYDQHDNKMFILDDLPRASVDETLAHELVHALQDQHFDLTTMLDYKPGDSDRITAGHALAEGDAMSAMFDLTQGDARNISARQLRIAMVASVAFSGSGSKTPRVLQASLIAPYIDGFRFVQELRARGGWDAVDAAYRALPQSTEQLLHLDKYDAREAPITVAIPALPEGFTQQDQDVLGEQGLRMVFEQWSSTDFAATAAAGWGGDRFVVGRRAHPGGDDWTAAWVIRFDTPQEAGEAAALLKKHQSQLCRERTNLGPFGFRHKGADLAIVVGPFTKGPNGLLKSAATCAATTQWLNKLL